MHKRHLAAFTDLETQRDQINAKLTALIRQTTEQGGDPALLDALPMLGDVLPQLPDRIKQQLFEAFDLTMLYHKKDNQITCWATITPSTPHALAAIIAQAGIHDLAAYLHDQDHSSDLSRKPVAWHAKSEAAAAALPFMILKDSPEGLWKILHDHGVVPVGREQTHDHTAGV